VNANKRGVSLLEISYYDILEVPSDAAENDIKRAYILKLRKYPNEKFPEEFKAIRKAYETLSNAKTRKEYDTMSLYGDEIEKLQTEASIALDNKDFAEAIKCYKRILVIEPSLLTVRNRYALALIYNEEQDKAIKQLEKLLQEEKENSAYIYNLGFAYDTKGDSVNAIYYYKRAFGLDPNDVNIIFSLSNVYLDLKDYQNAKKTLNEALSKNSSEGFHQFMYLFKHLQIDVFSKDSDSIGKTLKRIETLLEKYPDEKSYVANEFGKFAAELFDYKQFKWAYYLTEKGIELDPNHAQLLELHKLTIKNRLLYDEFEILEKDEKVIHPLRYNLFLYLFANEYSEAEFESHLEEMFKNVELAAKYQAEQTLNSLKRLNIKYPNLYKAREEFFESVLKISKENKIRDDQFERLKSDSQVVNSLKRLIALYLSETDEAERRSYFEDIMHEMSYDPASSVKMSINRLQNTYPVLYALNAEFLSDIKKKLTDSSKTNSYSSSNPNYQSSYSSNPSSSNSCFVATAAFGSPLIAELDYLRYWRDNYLNRSGLGKLFIKVYYRIGPFLARPVTKSNVLKRFTQGVIYKIISYIDNKHDLVNQFHKQTRPTQKR
jgi:tetratricopeptide (TPR) repeat protein